MSAMQHADASQAPAQFCLKMHFAFRRFKMPRKEPQPEAWPPTFLLIVAMMHSSHGSWHLSAKVLHRAVRNLSRSCSQRCRRVTRTEWASSCLNLLGPLSLEALS